MLTFAESNFASGALASWMALGLIAGTTAGYLLKEAYGLVGDLVMGLVGAVLGGFLFGLVVSGPADFWGSLVGAFLGAAALLLLVRAGSSDRTNSESSSTDHQPRKR